MIQKLKWASRDFNIKLSLLDEKSKDYRVNQALPFLHGRSLEITFSVPFINLSVSLVGIFDQ